jgi:hypothetical protein
MNVDGEEGSVPCPYKMSRVSLTLASPPGLTHIQGGVTLGLEQGEPGADVSPLGKRRRWYSLANDRIL